mgnify:CR=1 FL=1
MAQVELNDPIYRTTPERTTKMMVIMLGICIAGGGIFFGMWDYWISMPPPAGLLTGDVSGDGASEKGSGAVTLTGVEIDVPLSFVESSDFRVLAFNALPGEEGANPTINANVGDKINFDVINDGKSFHAFGVVSNPDDFTSVVFDSEIAAATNPLKPGESGSVTFLAGAPGTYYYICTVPGHALQGMQGTFIVE